MFPHPGDGVRSSGGAGGCLPARPVLRDALALPLLFKPGVQFRYSNSNYILLGMIIERLAGTRLGAAHRKGWPELLTSKGTLNGIELLEHTQEGENMVLIFRARFSYENLIWTVRIAKDGKIAGLEPQPE